MIEKIGSVKNPLTIIAIFAGIAEVSGTTVLPFITPQNQGVFIYFLIIFPLILIILFFLTLNFNNKALYAPSDFSNEENYIKIFRYDIAKQQNVEITVSYDNLLKRLNEDFAELKKSNSEKFLYLENELKLIEKNKTGEVNAEVVDEIPNGFFVYISDFRDSQEFKDATLKMGYDAKIYVPPEDGLRNKYDATGKEAIWLGSTVPLKMAKEVIKFAVSKYPFLKYIKVSTFGPEYIFIGGSTETATKRDNLKPLSANDFNKIQSLKTIEELHSLIDHLNK